MDNAAGEQVYSRRWYEEHIDRLLGELAAEAHTWLDRDREAPYEATAIASRITNLARALSANAHAIGRIDYEEYVRGR